MATQTAHRAGMLAASVLLASIVLALCVRPAAATLPDGRAYELVSPPAKAGADIIPNSFKTFAAADGNGVAFAGLAAFGEGVRGTSVDVQYLARRTGVSGTSGWTTHSVNPPGGASTLIGLISGIAPGFNAFSDDLTSGAWTAATLVEPAPNVGGVPNVYRLRNLEGDAPQAELMSASASALQKPPFPDDLTFVNFFDGASSDLSHVIFQSPYNLTGDGSYSPAGDLFESVEGVGLRRVGRIPSGSDLECDDVAGPACVDAPSVEAGLSAGTSFGSAYYATTMISRDGRRIVFQGPAGAASGPIYLREDGTRTYQVSPSGQAWGMSADGSRVYFTTSDALVGDDTDGTSTDLYMYDLRAPAGSRLTLVSKDTTGDPSLSVTGMVGASDDGNYVYFIGGGQFVTGEPAAVTAGLYVWHDGVVRYIGSFNDYNFAAYNTPRTVWSYVSQVKTSRLSPDGRHLLIMSALDDGFRGRGGYAGYDHGTCATGGFFGRCRELYLYSADSGSLVCVSCNMRSGVASGNALTDPNPGVSASPTTSKLSHALSDDGQHVFFSTPEALVAEDSNGRWDAYEYNVADGSVHLISSGASPSDSYFLDASSDGRNVFFVTRERLVGWDTDDNYDMYDARVGGGFPEPVLAGQGCVGEGCRGPIAGMPSVTAGASARFRGAGDEPGRFRQAKKPTRCKGRAVLRRVRGKRKCVRARSRRHRRHHARRGRAQSERSGR